LIVHNTYSIKPLAKPLDTFNRLPFVHGMIYVQRKNEILITNCAILCYVAAISVYDV